MRSSELALEIEKYFAGWDLTPSGPVPAGPHGSKELAQTALFIEHVKCVFVVYPRVHGPSQARPQAGELDSLTGKQSRRIPVHSIRRPLCWE